MKQLIYKAAWLVGIDTASPEPVNNFV